MFTKYKTENAWQELRVEGNKLYNARGDEVRLMGVNNGPLVWMAYSDYILENIIVAMDEWHANTIRLPLAQDTWFGFHRDQKGTDESGARYRAQVDEIIEAVASRQKYIILDLHRTNVNRWGEFISGGLPDMNSLVFWKDVATRYQNHPNVLFDPYNEPFQVTWEQWKNGGEITIWYAKKDVGQQIMFDKPEGVEVFPLTYEVPGMQRIVETIRAVGANNVLTIGGLDWSYELDGIVNGYALDDCGGNGQILDAHVYPCKELGRWDEFVSIAKEKYPILIGECGHYGEAPIPHEWPQLEESRTWVPKLLKWIDDHGYHLTAWDFHDTAGPPLVENLKDYTPTDFWGVYVKEFLKKHNVCCQVPEQARVKKG